MQTQYKMNNPTIVSESIETDDTASFEQIVYDNGEIIWVPINK